MKSEAAVRKALLALLMGLPAPIVAFIAGETVGPGVFAVISAYFVGCGFVIARKRPRTFWREWPSLLVLMAPLLVCLTIVARGEGPQGVPPYTLLLMAAWEAACAGVYLASRGKAPPASRKAALIVLGLPVLVLSGGAFAAYRSGRLVKPTLIDGVPCGIGWVAEHPDGKLRHCTLAADAPIRGVVVPAGSEVDISPSGNLVVRLGREAKISNAWLPGGAKVGVNPAGQLDFVALPRDMEIQGLVCRGGDWMTAFHPNGKLAQAFLAVDQVIQRVPCSRATFWRELNRGYARAQVQLWPDGSLRYCRAAREVTLQGVTFKEGDPVRLDEQGHPAASGSVRQP
jgi:hypothetical protein